MAILLAFFNGVSILGSRVSENVEDSFIHGVSVRWGLVKLGFLFLLLFHVSMELIEGIVFEDIGIKMWI